MLTDVSVDVGVDFVPLRNGRKHAHSDDFVAHLAEVLVACLEGSHFLGSTVDGLGINAVAVDT